MAQRKELILDNLIGTVNPTTTDDSTKFYQVSSRWINTSTGSEFVCVDSTEGIAVWKKTTLELGLENSLDGITVYNATGNQTFSGTVTVNLDTILTNTNVLLFTLLNSIITINFTGQALVSLNANIGNTSNNSGQSEVWVEQNSLASGFIEIAGTKGRGYHRNSSEESTNIASSVIVSVTTGDQFRLRAAQISGGTLRTLANLNSLTILRIN